MHRERARVALGNEKFIASRLWGMRKLLAQLGVATFLLTLVYAYSIGQSWVSRAKLSPVGRDPTGARLAVLANQFASLAGGAGVVESVEYYSELLRSRDLLSWVATRRGIPAAPPTHSLVEYWNASGSDSTAKLRATIRRLASEISVSTSRDANIVTVAVTDRDPRLSVWLCATLIDAVNDFNLTKRRSRATAERAFTESRLLAVSALLAQAEDDVRVFGEKNRQLVLSPALRLQESRLRRRADLQQSLFLSLSQALEQAKIDEVRDTPVITVIEGPSLTLARSASPILVAAVLTAAVVALAAIGKLYWSALFEWSRRSTGETC